MLQALLDPRSIAVVGASPDATRPGGRPIHYLKAHFQGAVLPVNPKYGEVQGLPCYPSLDDIKTGVDLVVLAVPARLVLDELRRAGRAGAKAVVVFAAGLSDVEAVGDVPYEQAVVAVARQHGISLLGPNTTGLANLATGAFSTFATVYQGIPVNPVASGIAIVGQSGATCNAIVLDAARNGTSVRYVVATGNEIALSSGDILLHLSDDPGVQAVVMYIEGLADGAAFMQAAKRLRARGVPLVALKVGASEKGREASASHTAALAGDDRVYAAALESANALRARDLGHLFDLAYLARFSSRAAGPRLGVLTASGAAAVMAADAASGTGLVIPTFSAAVQAGLAARIPAFGMVSNPIDLTANLLTDSGLLAHALDIMVDSTETDTVVIALAGHAIRQRAADVAAAARRSSKLIVVIDPDATLPRDTFDSSHVPVFHRFAEAFAALDTLVGWHVRNRGHDAPASAAARRREAPVSPEAAAVLDNAAAAHRARLDEAEGVALLAAFGLPVPRTLVMHAPGDAAAAFAQTGSPSVAKILSADVPHKSDIGGVLLGLCDAASVAAAFDQVLGSANAAAGGSTPITRVLLQSQAPKGFELLVGVRRDPVFGPVVTVGAGGVLAELQDDVVLHLGLVDEQQARAMLTRLKSFPLLDGFRGRPKADIAAACRVIAAISAVFCALDDRIEEIELNPVVVGPQGQGAVIVDNLVSLRR